MDKLLLPDPRDRSINTPSILVGSKEVVAYYKQETGKPITNDRNVIKDWYNEEAKEFGWYTVEFQGDSYQCLLKAHVAIIHGSTHEVVSTDD